MFIFNVAVKCCKEFSLNKGHFSLNNREPNTVNEHSPMAFPFSQDNVVWFVNFT